MLIVMLTKWLSFFLNCPLSFRVFTIIRYHTDVQHDEKKKLWVRHVSWTRRIKNTSKNPNLYPHLNKITYHYLPWDTLYNTIFFLQRWNRPGPHLSFTTNSQFAITFPSFWNPCGNPTCTKSLLSTNQNRANSLLNSSICLWMTQLFCWMNLWTLWNG